MDNQNLCVDNSRNAAYAADNLDILRTGSDAFERSFQPNDGCTYRVYHQLLVLFSRKYTAAELKVSPKDNTKRDKFLE